MLEVLDPYSQSVVHHIPYTEGLDDLLAAAAARQKEWSREPLSRRQATVRAALPWFKTNCESIASDISRQMGKPLQQARQEVNTMLQRAEALLELSHRALAPEELPPLDGFIRRIESAPVGIVLVIAPWNYPLLTAVNIVVPALLAGNVVLLKHSAQTPLCGEHFAAAFGGLVTPLVLRHGDVADLIQHPATGYVSLTGSDEAGRSVYRTAAHRLLDVGLELGGKDAAYVAADADIAKAADNLVDCACYNAGQSCCAIERVYVHRSRYADFLDRAREVMQSYRLGDPQCETTTMGPLVNAAAVERQAAQVAEAVQRGAELLHGGRCIESSWFFPPTLLSNVPQDTRAMQEETFGPLLPVAPVDSDEEALSRMNDSRYGLTASVWTSDVQRAERFASALQVGTVFMNRCDYLDPRLPWSGWKDSGLGCTLSHHGFSGVTRKKSLHFRLDL